MQKTGTNATCFFLYLCFAGIFETHITLTFLILKGNEIHQEWLYQKFQAFHKLFLFESTIFKYEILLIFANVIVWMSYSKRGLSLSALLRNFTAVRFWYASYWMFSQIWTCLFDEWLHTIDQIQVGFCFCTNYNSFKTETERPTRRPWTVTETLANNFKVSWCFAHSNAKTNSNLNET